MRLRGLALILLVASFGLAAAACGGDDGGGAAEPTTTEATTTEATTAEETTTEDSGGGGGTTIELAADPAGGLSFDKESLSASAGEIKIELTNDSTNPHNVSVEGQTSETITEGSTSLELNLDAGEYEFICAVPGHADGGMRGTLTVN
jgi:plastocyanin